MCYTFTCHVNDSGNFMSNEIQVWTVDKGEGTVQPECNKSAEGTVARYTENTVSTKSGNSFSLHVYR
jgi:hypothetical protein